MIFQISPFRVSGAKPYSLVRKLLSASLILLICLLGISAIPPKDVVPSAEDILHFVNLHRKSKGLKPLVMNAFESSVALQHSRNMASGKTPFGHKGMDARIKTIGKELGPLSAAGENVAYGSMSAEEVVDGWLHSPGHKRNIEGDFSLTGIACAKDKKGMIYYTEIFTK